MISPVDPSAPFTCGPTTCDRNAHQNQYPPPPSCTPPEGCFDYDPDTCACRSQIPGGGTLSPIIMAVGQNSSYHLTSASQGVLFDLDADGAYERTSWTRPDDSVGLLVLDRNQNGLIDNGRELFGNFTPLEGDQTARHGFEALAAWDAVDAGGNGDGFLDSRDAVWNRLAVWLDLNHDGISQPGEFHALSEFNITGIETTARSEMRRDQHGNLFRLKAQFTIDGHPRWAYDVFLAVIRQ